MQQYNDLDENQDEEIKIVKQQKTNLQRIKELLQKKKKQKSKIKQQEDVEYDVLDKDEQNQYQKQQQQTQFAKQTHRQQQFKKRVQLASSIKKYHVKDLQILKKQIKEPIQPGQTITTILMRNNQGFNKVFPQFDLYSIGFKHILSAKKRSGNKTSNYSISVDKNDVTAYSPSYVAKLRANFMKTQFNLYDTGKNFTQSQQYRQTRINLMTVNYNSNYLIDRGPRQMQVYLPPIKNQQDFKQVQKQWNLKVQLTNGNDLISLYRNRAPLYDQQSKKYYLDFGNRIDRPSVKNFILEDSQGKQVVMFGRLSQDIFRLVINHPFSILQGFTLAVSNLDIKIV